MSDKRTRGGNRRSCRGDHMIKVEQQVIDRDAGDCFVACVASILELPLSAVPSIHTEPAWDAHCRWLNSANLALVQITHHPGDIAGYAIRSIRSYTFEERSHAVVTHNGMVVWDPSPNRKDYDDDCYKTWTRHWVLVPIDITRPIETSKLL